MSDASYTAIHRNYWSKLKILAKNKQYSEFFELYAEYLEKSGILSESREILYQASRGVSQLIKDKES